MQDHHRHLLRLHLRRSDVVALLLAAMIGCAAPQSPPRATEDLDVPAETLSSTDPCAQRLHDLSGGLLLHQLQHQRLPPNLSVLQLPGGAAGVADALVCPVSSQPYVYDPRGLRGPDGKSRLIVYDSAPSHAGRRWAIAWLEPEGAPPQTEVIAVPEHYFTATP